jgi:hypothetical protein
VAREDSFWPSCQSDSQSLNFCGVKKILRYSRYEYGKARDLQSLGKVPPPLGDSENEASFGFAEEAE